MEVNNITIPGDAYPFTPGPWTMRAYNGYDAYKSHVIWTPTPENKKPNNENYIAKVNWFPFDRKHGNEVAVGLANAQLIAAAPDLLVAAQLAAEALFNANADARPAILALDRAIKKVYGNGK